MKKTSELHHEENHKIHRSGGLRAAVLGANDGIVSISSIIVGVAASGALKIDIILAGTAGLIAGACAMAAGEYVSVKSQEDTENADLAMEKEALEKFPEEELLELAAIYEKRGLDSNLALEVAKQMTAHNALEAHARDEIGITDELSANPLQAAFWSAFAFIIGGIIPVVASWTINLNYIYLIPILIPILTIILLAILGAIAGYISGASCLRGALRVCFWGIIAMSLTYLVGNLFNTSLI
ncbi:MAG: VIT family protein [Verrucomicrobiota bacterium]|nr:VIT family protein [Verrucomicrobiota bacterium]MEC8517951.1 VIT family protein [Verrucomicrobiota bacterium]